MTVIHKFRLNPLSEQVIHCDVGQIYPIAVADQHGDVCLWAEIRPCESPVFNHIHVTIVATGREFEPNPLDTYLGTVVQPTHDLVWHVYYRYGMRK